MIPLDDRLDRIWERAKAAQKEDREPVAAELMSAYLRHRPEHAAAWHLYGDSLRMMGLYHEAKRALIMAYELEPSGFVAGRLGQLHHDHGDLTEAEHWYGIATSDPESGTRNWMWIMRGANLASMNQLLEAEACHRRALTLDEAVRDEAYLNLGYVLRAQGRYSEAAEAFRQALVLTPDYILAQRAVKSLDGIDDAILLAKEIPPPTPDELLE